MSNKTEVSKRERYFQTVYMDRELSNEIRSVASKSGATINSTYIKALQLGLKVMAAQDIATDKILSHVRDGRDL